MTQKQFEFIMKSLKAELLSSIHIKEFWCETNPDHPCPDRRSLCVVYTEDIDRAIEDAFAELMESGNNDK